jgi:hypothetical protein
MDVNSRLFPIFYNGLKLSTRVISGPLFNRFWYRYLHWRKRAKGQQLNLRNPTTFSDRIIWLKLYYEIPNAHVLVDKFLVREHVEKRIGAGHLIPLLGNWENADDINFADLPNRFVAKASHGSGWNIVCDDKRQLDIALAKRTLNKYLKMNYYFFGREKPYRHCPPRIVIEKHLNDISESEIRDYKFFCFDGQPHLVQIDVDRYADHRQAFYDMQWNKQHFHQLYPPYTDELARPPELDEMIDIARRLSTNLPFARIDLFNHGGTVFFGEITFHPHGGFAPFFPPEFDRQLGQQIHLPEPSQPSLNQPEQQPAQK